MRFIANSVVNAQGFTSEAKDVNLSLYKGILPVYMGNFYVRCEVRGCPSGDFRGNLNEIHSQLLTKLQEYPFETIDVILSLYKASCCAHFWAFYVQ